MSETKNILKKALGTLFGLFLICFILVNLYALGTFLYSTPSVEPVPENGNLPPERFSKSIEQPLGADHFHILDETVYTDVQNAPTCLKCHGNFCHTKSEWLRSFFNMHTFSSPVKPVTSELPRKRIYFSSGLTTSQDR